MEAIIKVHPEARARYVNLSWDFTFRTLLFRYSLAEDEIEKLREELKRFYQSIPPEKFQEEAGHRFQAYFKKIDILNNSPLESKESLVHRLSVIIKDLSGVKGDKSLFMSRVFSKIR